MWGDHMKQKHYIAGLYYRKSQEDERQGESISIENQRMILRKYAEERGFEIHDEYIDDGVSGTTFDRPEVQRLLDDAKTGIINTIIVKDLSRFGRNYIEVGQYVDYVFPAFNIRFIAIQDNIDTENADNNAMEMMPVVNIFNEWHAANTSKKIKAVKRSNAFAGIYSAKRASYGYIKGTDKKRTPVIDEETAPVVKRIFEMYASGLSHLRISEILNEEGVLSPGRYAFEKLGQKGFPNGKDLWCPVTVRRILNNIIYLGHLPQLQTTTVSYKNHKIRAKDQSDWAIIYNNHEPIVSQELWDRAQARKKSVSNGRKTRTGTTHPLSGFLFCADCGSKMKLNGCLSHGKMWYSFNCGDHFRYGKSICFSHYISAKTIEEIVLVNHTSDKDYAREEKPRVAVHIPQAAMIRSYEKASLFRAPNGTDFAGYSYYLPNSVLHESADGSNAAEARLAEDFTVKMRKGEEEVELTAKEFSELVGKTTEEDYKGEPTAMDEYREQQAEKEQWKEIAVSEQAVIANYEKSTLFKMPKGKYEGMVYYIPSGMVRRDENGIRLRLPEDFEVHLKDKSADENIDLSPAELESELAGKTDEDYESIYRRPSEEARKKFEQVEKNLRESLPDEMKNKPNWVVVRTRENKETGRLDKFLIDVHTGKFAESNDMEYYQDRHFITMTGDGATCSELASFDTPEMKSLLERKLERRTEWKNVGKGEAGLSQMDDRELLEKAFSAKNGDTVRRLYHGEDLRHNHSNSDMSLMNYLAFYSGGNVEQMTRIFATSGLYRPDKPASYYEYTAIKAAKDTPHYTPPRASSSAPKSASGGNSK